MDIALVYMVAGISARFNGEIKSFAKISKDKTLIEYSLEQAIPSGFTKIIFIVGKHTESPFREKFGDSYKGIPIEYCFQEYDKEKRDKPWGTTDALCCAENVLNCPFILINGDDLHEKETFRIVVEHLKDKDTSVTVGYKLRDVLSEKGGVNRGIIKVKDNLVESFTETYGITKENLHSMGLNENSLSSQSIWGLYPETLKELRKILIKFKEKNKNDRKVECNLTSELTNLIKQKKIRMEIYPTKGRWFGITNPGDELIIRYQLNQQNL